MHPREKEFHYQLPPDRVGKTYPTVRSDCKLMVIDRASKSFYHHRFADVLEYISDQLVYGNDAFYEGPVQPPGRTRQPVYASRPGTSVTPSAGIPIESWMLKEFNLRYAFLSTPPKIRPSVDEMYDSGKSIPEPYFIDWLPESPVFVVGTTACKALESWALTKRPSGVSDLLITPGFEFKMTKSLLTNFHYPGEPLLALTCAFGGTELILKAYKEAMELGYLISDCGDRMLIL
jgi:S-adenosylmethionine:tRNA-ribosyltransferase-isomerase (queuine synthetase)